jgi:serine/threonine protein phosphatase 1
MRTLAVGDIHGCSAALDALLAVVQPTPADLLVFLGDYVDRGPDSRGVIDRLIALRQSHRVVCLRGNHELMMTEARRDKGELRNWLAVGGVQTMNSYTEAGWRATFDNVPAEHWDFLEEGLFDFFETDTHIFVHANLDASTPLADQTDMDLFWEFLDGPVRHESGKIMVCGHSTQRNGLPKAWPTTYCLDTGAYAGGWLTCLDVTSQKYWQSNNNGQTRTADLDIEE